MSDEAQAHDEMLVTAREAAAKPGDLLYRSEWETAREVLHEEAWQIARRFINGHFRNADREHPRIGIPARPDYDDDLPLNTYIKQQARKDAARPAVSSDPGDVLRYAREDISRAYSALAAMTDECEAVGSPALGATDLAKDACARLAGIERHLTDHPEQPPRPADPVPGSDAVRLQETLRTKADQYVQTVTEWDDRTSPEDWPEALLITGEELHRLLMEFAQEVCGATRSDRGGTDAAGQAGEGGVQKAAAPIANYWARRFADVRTRFEAGGTWDDGDIAFLIRAAEIGVQAIRPDAVPPPPVSPAPVGVGSATVDVLKWYAEQARLCRLIHSEGDSGRRALSDDSGKRAEDILARIAAPVVATEQTQALYDRLDGDSLDAIMEVIGEGPDFAQCNKGKSAMRGWFLGRLRRLWNLPEPPAPTSTPVDREA